MSYHGLQPFGFLLLFTLSNTSFPTRCLLSLLTCLINKFFHLRTGCQGDNREQESFRLRGPFPFHTLPRLTRLRLTSPALPWMPWVGRGVKGVCALQGEFVIPHPHRMTGPYCFHSSTTTTPFRARSRQDMLEKNFVWHFLLLLLKWFILFIKHQGNTSVCSSYN